MIIIYAAVIAFVLDLLLGDPNWMPHPVVYMGKMITALEKQLRNTFPKSPEGERMAGAILAAVLPSFVLLFSGGIIYIIGKIHPLLSFALQVLWGWQALAMKGLKDESMNVYHSLKSGVEAGRRAVARIVGRDTENLTEIGVIKATVETVAENFSDGVLAPMFYFIIGGAPLALCYKAVNTMDSMVGYKNDKYIDFGRAAAKLDDAANYIPSRLSALILIAATVFTNESTRGAWQIWRRDRRNHASPNSAQTEAAMAGALEIQLAGPAYYFGKLYEKPTIGDRKREIETDDIKRADKLLYIGGFIGLVVLCCIRVAIVLI